MTTKVQLFVSIKNEAVARPLGVRRLRQAPATGQRFQIPLDGRAVHARITRFSAASDPVSKTSVPTVHAEEI